MAKSWTGSPEYYIWPTFSSYYAKGCFFFYSFRGSLKLLLGILCIKFMSFLSLRFHCIFFHRSRTCLLSLYPPLRAEFQYLLLIVFNFAKTFIANYSSFHSILFSQCHQVLDHLIGRLGKDLHLGMWYYMSQRFVSTLLMVLSADNKSDHESYHHNADHAQSSSSAVTRREKSHISAESRALSLPQSSILDHQAQQEGSFASNRASFGGSSHDTSCISESDSNDSGARSHETFSQYPYSHWDYFSQDCVISSHYDTHLTIEEDPSERYLTYQQGAQYVATTPTTENGLQGSNNEVYTLQMYSPTTEMWTLQESRDERIRLGLPGSQTTAYVVFDCD